MPAHDTRAATASRQENAAGTPIRSSLLRGKRGEQLVFLLLAVLIWPFVAVAVVGGYGFLVWMYQLLAGPPGPPGG
jgi:nitrate reductase NapE